MSDISRIQPYALPAEFVRQWNDAADDSLITANEYRAIQGMAKASETTEDDRFLADLDGSHLESVASAARNAGLQFSDIKVIAADASGYQRSIGYQRDFRARIKDGERPKGVNGAAIGYSSQRVKVGDASFGRLGGVHTDITFGHPVLSLGVLHTSLRTQADLVFGSDGVALTVGAGPMVHLGMPGWVQVYGGVSAYGLVGSVGGKGRIGGAVNATAGVQALIFYGEADFPVVGGDVRPAQRISIGLRAGF